jgi:hypothetical protein
LFGTEHDYSSGRPIRFFDQLLLRLSVARCSVYEDLLRLCLLIGRA